ncbi:MAG: rod shape-determining protein RodA [Candidatus Hydrogenedentota bacterium]|nr:MAG: rod shape-determining protein RodA [Candidatus Hydrogenedentota bacterium]
MSASTSVKDVVLRLSRKWDLQMILPVLSVWGISLAAIYTIAYHPIAVEIRQTMGLRGPTAFTKHLMWGGIAVGAFLLFAGFSREQYERFSFPAFLIFVVTLVLVLAAGIKVRGIRAWLGISALRFQPSELGKAVTVLALARILASDRNSKNVGIRRLFLAVSAVVLPALLIILQPDTGTALVYLALLATVPFAAGIPVRYPLVFALSLLLAMWRLLAGIGSGITGVGLWGWLGPSFVTPQGVLVGWGLLGGLGIVTALLMRRFHLRGGRFLLFCTHLPWAALAASFWIEHRLKPYQRLRLLAFLSPQSDPKGSGYNVLQSQIAFGSGGWLGRGMRGATQSTLGFLPERQTDFIFGVIGEVFGFLGAALVLFALGWLVLRILQRGRWTQDRFGRLVAVGAATILTVHIAVNTGMVMGVFPVMGIPLPFASYGGSAFLGLGILLGMVEACTEREKVRVQEIRGLWSWKGRGSVRG